MIKLICVAIILLSIIGCGEDKQSLPVIFSLDAKPNIVLPGNPSTITVEAGDPDKSKLSYLWTASSGQINGNGKTVTWTSPKEEGKYEITVTVSDGTDSATQKIFLRVWIPRPGDYYPLAVGNKWTYNDKEGNIINFEVIDIIDIAGTKAFVKKTTISNMEDSATYSYVSKGTDVVNQHAVGGASAGDDTLRFTPVLPLYKFPLIPEESWNVEFEVNVPDGFFVGSGKSTYKVL
ncbi:MAG: PKD domain-containing protein, partial [Candidatus Poribacteria bacterium]